MTAVLRAPGRSGAIGLVGAAVNGAFGFLLTTVLTRVYGADGAGVLFSVIGVVTIAGAVCCLGADTALMWALPRLRPVDNPAETSQSRATLTPTQCRGGGGGGARNKFEKIDASQLMTVALLPGAGLAILVAATGIAAATPIAHALNVNDPALLRLAFGGVPIIVAATILLAAVRATRPIQTYVGIQFVLVPILRPLLLLLAGASLLLGLTAWLLPLAVALLMASALAPRPSRRPAGWRPFWSYALPRAVSVAVDASSMWIGVLLTGALANPGEAGLFAAAGRYALAGLLIMQGLRVAIAPQLSTLLSNDAKDEAAALYRRTTLTIVALSFPAYLMLGIFAPAFLSLFGPEFAEAAAPLAVLCVAMLVNVGVGLVQTVLLMSGDSRGHLYATLLGLALNVAACLLLIPRLGALGAALAWSLGIVAENLLAAILARRALRRPLSSRPLWLTAAGAIAGTSLAAAAGLAVGGRNLPGLAVAVGVLLVAGATFTARKGRRWRSGT